MSRFYTVQFSGTSISTTADLFNVAATASMAFKLHQLEIGCDGATAIQELRVSVQRWTATVTNGTGGASFTPLPLLYTDAASTITSRVCDTSRASSTGTKQVLLSQGLNILNGIIWVPAPEYRPMFSLSQNLLIGLEVAPSSALDFSGYCILEEAF